MKLGKLLLVGALAVQTASAFAADVTLRFTGSTAFRSSTITAIKDWYVGNSATGLKIVYSGASLTGGGQQGFLGTVGGRSYLIQCSWSGSQEGVEAVASKTPVSVSNFFTETVIAASGTTSGVALGTSGNVESALADVALADNSQAESGKTAVSLYNTLTSERVGVIPFVWMRGKSNNAASQAGLNKVTNITSLQARSILGGFAPLSLFTNDQVDVGTYVSVVGRNNLSGTRLNTFVEPGFGRDSAPVQYAYTITSGAITALDGYATPEDGYSSGSNVVTGVNTPVDASLTDVVFGYAGIADAAKITGVTFDNVTGTYSGAGAVQILAFNGVPYSHAAVRNGSYTFWNYEYMMRRNTLAGDALNAFNGIKTYIVNADAAVGGIKLSTMNVERNGAGQLISSLN